MASFFTPTTRADAARQTLGPRPRYDSPSRVQVWDQGSKGRLRGHPGRKFGANIVRRGWTKNNFRAHLIFLYNKKTRLRIVRSFALDE